MDKKIKKAYPLSIEDQQKAMKLLGLYRAFIMAKTTKEQDRITDEICKLEKEMDF